MATREQHLEWCKERAKACLDAGNPQGAFDSMMSDMVKHPETRGHQAFELAPLLLRGGQLETVEQMRDFIEGIY